MVFLGFLISSGGIKMDSSKVAAITSWPVPKSIHNIVIVVLSEFSALLLHQ
jgi:hypothetical protein